MRGGVIAFAAFEGLGRWITDSEWELQGENWESQGDFREAQG